MADLPELPSPLSSLRQDWFSRLIRSQILRAFVLLLLVGLGFIPLGMVNGVLTERQMRQSEVRASVRQGWGNRQVIWGPIISLPLTRIVPGEDKKPVEEMKMIEWLPAQIKVTGKLSPEMRHRGIYKVPVYTLATKLSGQFTHDVVIQETLEGWVPHWDQAVVSLGVGDISGLLPGMHLKWGAQSLLIRPQAHGLSTTNEGIHAKISELKLGQSVPFEWDLTLRGGDLLAVLPAGNETHIALSGQWPNPSFKGAFLPTQRSVSHGAFDAQWQVSSFARSYPSQNLFAPNNESTLSGSGEESLSTLAFEHADSVVGRSVVKVSLLPGIDIYRETERALKYGGLFLLFHFMAVWLLELTLPLTLHLLHYLLSGMAMVLFFLILISLAEHIGFGPAYTLASLTVLGLNGSYLASLAPFAKRKTVLMWVLVLQSGLFLYLYMVLQQEDYSLLLGTLGLTGALAAAMVASKRIGPTEG
jgi:inner membrane protein